MINPKRVLITAGGTQEQIDDVRYIGNFSSGRFGHALAHTYSNDGDNVTLLAPTSVCERFGTIDGVEHIPFTSAEDLRTKLLGIEAADLVLHAAAVSDYTPIRTAGKISSDQEELTVTLSRTPKILSLLRAHFGEKTIIAGFKLLSDVTEEHLINIASKQIVKNDTDYCIANRLEDINRTTGERSIHIVGLNSKAFPIQGSTEYVAKALHATLSLREAAV